VVRVSPQLESHIFLQVAKLVNSSDIGADGRKKIFDAVGFSFINRLLATSMGSEVKYMYVVTS
jgi:hypothetical protein